MSGKGLANPSARHMALAGLATAVAVYSAQGPAAAAAVRTGTSVALHGGTGLADPAAQRP